MPTYNVIPGEPQHGKVREEVHTVSDDEIAERLLELFEGDTIYPDTIVVMPDGDYAVGEWLSAWECSNINKITEEGTADDFDYGRVSDKLLEAIYRIVEGQEYEYETQEYL